MGKTKGINRMITGGKVSWQEEIEIVRKERRSLC
jgi:hypothetical protein